MHRLPLWILAFATTFAPLKTPAIPLPGAGDSFEIHQETVVSGTASLEGAEPERIEQRIEVWGKALVNESDPEKGVELRYSFDRVILEIEIGDFGRSRLEVQPGRVVLDGTPVYDREKNPDIPVGLLDLIVNEEFVVRLTPEFAVEEIREFRRNRSERSYFDLLESVRSTLVPRPPEGVGVGESWGTLELMEMLGGDFTLPATETYRFNEAPTTDRPILTLQRMLQARLEKPHPIPVRMGLLAEGGLIYDALGPNLIAPPPGMRMLEFEIETRGVAEIDAETGFLKTSGALSDIRLVCEVPPIDGTQMRRKSLILTRQSLLSVQRSPDIGMTAEERGLLFGSDGE